MIRPLLGIVVVAIAITSINCNLCSYLPANNEVDRFLAEAHQKLTTHKQQDPSTPQRKKVIVIGNESCDLDSAVSAIGLAYYYQHLDKSHRHGLPVEDYDFLPVLNIYRNELRLKTEVTHHFETCAHITLTNIICIDDLIAHQEILDDAQIILVDHNKSTNPSLIKNDKVIQIYDHHLADDSIIPQETKARSFIKKPEEVGSCSSLITEQMLPNKHHLAGKNFNGILELFLGAILIDNGNMMKGDKGKLVDKIAYKGIVSQLQLDPNVWKNYLGDLERAKENIDGVFGELLLSKDLKFVWGQTNGLKIAVPRIPIPASQYFTHNQTFEQGVESVKKFMADPRKECDVLVLMGKSPTKMRANGDVAGKKDKKKATKAQAETLVELDEDEDEERMDGLKQKKKKDKKSKTDEYKQRDFAIFAREGKEIVMNAIIESIKTQLKLQSHEISGDTQHFFIELDKGSNRKAVIPLIEKAIEQPTT